MAAKEAKLPGLLSLEECLKDSPSYRKDLHRAEQTMDSLSLALEAVITNCTAMVQQSQNFGSSVRSFLQSVDVVGQHESFKDDPLVGTAINRITSVLGELEDLRSLMVDQANSSIATALSTFLRTDVKVVKDIGKTFTKLSDELDGCRARYAQIPKGKALDDTKNLLIALQTGFSHISTDYCYHINVLKMKQRSEILEQLLAFMYAQLSHFMQGADTMKDFEPCMRELSVQLTDVASRARTDQRAMEERHTAVQSQKDSINAPTLPPVSEGYLYKRGHNALRTWQFRYFKIHEGRLMYGPRSKEELKPFIGDLRICSVKPTPSEPIDRQFAFELVTPYITHVLQAESPAQHAAWVAALQREIESALKVAGPAPAKASARDADLDDEARSLQQDIAHVEGNDCCADCRAPNPDWASINFGITLCLNCSGIHRGFGTHLSKVRSLGMDEMEPEVSQIMLEIGNRRANDIFEANAPEKRITAADSVADKQAYIHSKYIERKFVAQRDAPRAIANKELVDGAAAGSCTQVLRGLAMGADPNAANAEGIPALAIAAGAGGVSVMELLLLNNSNVDAADASGRTALMHAVLAKQTPATCALLKHNAKVSKTDSSNRDALAMALDLTQADMVTLLRLAAIQDSSEPFDDRSDWLRDFRPQHARHPSTDEKK